MRVDIDFTFFKALLQQKREQIRTHREEQRKGSGVVELDQSRVGRLSRMDALQQQSMARAAGERSARELRRVEAALRRLEAGEYGICLECGEDIPEKRLRADPAAHVCLPCAAISEK
mgnify:CR=1 FL=1